MVRGNFAGVVEEAVRYLGWDLYHHSTEKQVG
jgi:hypothetical protein